MAPPKKTVPLVFGAGNFSTQPARLADQRDMIEVALRNNIKAIDTSRHYAHGESENFLGSEGVPSHFEIMTKASGDIVPEGLTKDGIIKGWHESEAALRVNHVGTYLIHVPDDNSPIADAMEGIQALHLAGKFDKFGLSNLTAEQVKACYSYAKSKGYILPTCYQAVYNLASRKTEKALFPLLRRLGISIQAYSPIASGFLVKTPEDVRAGRGTFDPTTIFGKVLNEMYCKDSFLVFLQKYNELAEEIGSSRVGLAVRWVVWNSALRAELGDCMIPGASSGKQLQVLIDEVAKGPLDECVVQRLEAMWNDVEHDAPENNFATYRKLQKARVL